VHNFRDQVAIATKLSTVGLNFYILSMVASYNPSNAYNYEIAPRFLGKLCTSEITHCSKISLRHGKFTPGNHYLSMSCRLIQ
jgi:hypothetical protein